MMVPFILFLVGISCSLHAMEDERNVDDMELEKTRFQYDSPVETPQATLGTASFHTLVNNIEHSLSSAVQADSILNPALKEEIKTFLTRKHLISFYDISSIFWRSAKIFFLLI